MVQLAPPYIHIRKAAEHSIRTFKNYFVSGLALVDKNFPIYLWCRIVKQAEIFMNLLQKSRTNPRLLLYEQIFGKFSFNANPMVPPGRKIIAHEKTNQPDTWRKHRVVGWYIVPPLEQYRCYKVFVTKTISE